MGAKSGSFSCPAKEKEKTTTSIDLLLREINESTWGITDFPHRLMTEQRIVDGHVREDHK